MSTVRNSEPQAHGVILFKTTFGDLEVELFTQQCPRATRNFVQLCLDGYYNETIFDRVERDFIAVGGALQDDEPDDRRDKAGTFKDEFHPRLRFTRRGLMATANTEKDANGPEFFFTLGPTPELQDKNTIFGRLKGDSVYYLVDLNETQVDEDLVPISEKKILETHVIENPYPDLEPRKGLKRAVGMRANKNDSDDDDDKPKFDRNKKLSFDQDESDDDDDDEDNEADVKPPPQSSKPEPERVVDVKLEPKNEESSEPKEVKVEEEDPRERRLREIRAQIAQLKKQIDNEPPETKVKKTSERRAESKQLDFKHPTEDSVPSNDSSNNADLIDSKSRNATKKSRHSERETFEILENFKKKLKQSKSGEPDHDNRQDKKTIDESFEVGDGELNLDDLDKVDGDAWMRHKFEAEDEERLAKDANTKDDDWYSIEDPRNPMTKRIESQRSDRDAKSSSHRRDDHRDRRERDDDRDRRHHRDDRHKREDLRQFSRHHHSRRT